MDESEGTEKKDSGTGEKRGETEEGEMKEEGEEARDGEERADGGGDGAVSELEGAEEEGGFKGAEGERAVAGDEDASARGARAVREQEAKAAREAAERKEEQRAGVWVGVRVCGGSDVAALVGEEDEGLLVSFLQFCHALDRACRALTDAMRMLLPLAGAH